MQVEISINQFAICFKKGTSVGILQKAAIISKSNIGVFRLRHRPELPNDMVNVLQHKGHHHDKALPDDLHKGERWFDLAYSMASTTIPLLTKKE